MQNSSQLADFKSVKHVKSFEIFYRISRYHLSLGISPLHNLHTVDPFNQQKYDYKAPNECTINWLVRITHSSMMRLKVC